MRIRDITESRRLIPTGWMNADTGEIVKAVGITHHQVLRQHPERFFTNPEDFIQAYDRDVDDESHVGDETFEEYIGALLQTEWVRVSGGYDSVEIETRNPDAALKVARRLYREYPELTMLELDIRHLGYHRLGAKELRFYVKTGQIPRKRIGESEEVHPFWHMTTKDAGNQIMQHGFTPQPTQQHGPGVSICVNHYVASEMFISLRRMYRMDTFDRVKDFWSKKGIHPDLVDYELARWHRQGRSEGPQGFYLYTMGTFHPAVGGDARVSMASFLWNDLAKKFIGKEPVCIYGEYHGPVDPRLQQPTDMVEAEVFVRDVGLLDPKQMTTDAKVVLNQFRG